MAIPDCVHGLGDIDRERCLRIIRFRVTPHVDATECLLVLNQINILLSTGIQEHQFRRL